MPRKRKRPITAGKGRETFMVDKPPEQLLAELQAAVRSGEIPPVRVEGGWRVADFRLVREGPDKAHIDIFARFVPDGPEYDGVPVWPGEVGPPV